MAATQGVGRHHQPADRRAPRDRRQQVPAGDPGGEAGSPDQRLLLAARRGPARVRRPAGRDPRAGEAALDRAARDPRGHAEGRADSRARPSRCPSRHGARHPWRGRRHRRVQGLRAAPAAQGVGPHRPGRPDPGRAPLRGRADVGGAVRRAGDHRRLDRRRRGAARADSARPPTWCSSPPRPRTCSPGPPPACPTTCSPRRCSPPAARSSTPRPCTPRCGSTRPPRHNVATLRRRGVSRGRARPSAGSPARTAARGACRSQANCSRWRKRSSARGRCGRPAPSAGPGAVIPLPLAGRRVLDLRRRDARGTRPGPVPRQLVHRHAGLRVRPVGGRPGRRRHRWWPPTWSSPTRSGAKVIRGRLGPGHARRDAGRGAARGRDRDDGGGRRLPPRRARRRRRSRRTAPCRRRSTLTENPDILADLSARRQGAARPAR